MPSWTNFHTHTPFCDGTGTIDEYIAAACAQNVTALGFSSHAPLTFEPEWTLAVKDVAEYCRQVRKVAEIHTTNLPIYCALEIDYIPGVIWPGHPQFDTLDLDYTIGAVHIGGFLDKDRAWSIDGSPESFAEGVALHEGNPQNAVMHYYHLIREMVQQYPPDIVAHLDVVKKNNQKQELFNESDEWYRREVTKTLDCIAEAGCLLEVNTGGIARGRCNTYFPSPWILKLALARNIPLVLSSDCHVPQQITAEFSAAAIMLKSIGCNELFSFTAQGWQPFLFSSEGLENDVEEMT